jgi:hypothetical protein
MARQVSVLAMTNQIKLMTQDPDFVLADSLMYCQLIGRNFARLYAMYVEAEPDRYRQETQYEIGVDPLDLPSDWYSTIAVDYLLPGNRREPLIRLQEQDRNRFFNETGQARAYRIIENSIVLYPTPQNGQKYILISLPTAPILQESDSVDLRIGHEKYLEQTTARDLLNTENSYDGRWDEEIAKLEAELKYEANMRYFSDMARMTSDYQQRYRSWPFSYPFGVRW